MSTLDIVIVAFVALGAVRGFASGLFRQVVSVVGFAAGLLVAVALSSAAGDWLSAHAGGSQPASRAAAFVLLWVGVPIALSWAASLLTHVARAMQLGCLVRLGGTALGALKYAVLLSCMLNVAATMQWMPEETTAASRFYVPAKALAGTVFHWCLPHFTGQPT